MTAYSADDRLPRYRLVGEDSSSLEGAWNALLREYDLPFRQFHVGAHSTIGSRTAWLERYLRVNASRFGHGKNAVAEDILEDVLFMLHLAMAKLSRLQPEQAEQVFGRPVTARLTVWKFLDPPDALVTLSGFAEAHTADEQRRREKAAALRRWDAAWQDAKGKAVRLLRDPERIEALLPRVVEHLAAIEEQIEAAADQW